MFRNILFVFCLFFSSLLFSQPQMMVWHLGEDFIEHTNGRQSTTKPASSFPNITSANGMYHATLNTDFHIVDREVFNTFGQTIGHLNPNQDEFSPEMAIVPVPESPCRYYVINTVVDIAFAHPGTLEFHIIDMSLNQGSGGIASQNNVLGVTNECFAQVGSGLAIGKYNTATQSRRMYVLRNGSCQNGDELELWDITSSGIVFNARFAVPNLTGSALQTHEMDLSHDGLKLAWAIRDGSTQHDVTICDINPISGHVVGFKQIDVGGDPLFGVEFDATATNLFVCDGQGLHYINVGSGNVTALPNSNAYNATMLEMAPSGMIYGSDGTQLGQIDPSGPSFNPAPGVFPGIAGYAFNSALGGSGFCLPDQIDGENYQALRNAAYCCESIFDVGQHSVATDDTWGPTGNPFNPFSTTIYVQDEIRILENVEVNIDQMEFRFSAQGDFVIDQHTNPGTHGGRVIATNSEFTSLDCKVGMWNGFDVLGSQMESQLPYNLSPQGLLSLTDCHVNNALIAVHLGSANCGAGGILRSYTSSYKNNVIGVKFDEYHNFLPSNGNAFRNISILQENSFLTQGVLNNGQPPQVMIHMTKVDWVGLRGNSHVHAFPQQYSKNNAGRGVVAEDANFALTPLCPCLGPPGTCGCAIPNYFEGFLHAVLATNSDPLVSATVRESKFVDNGVGVRIEGATAPVIVENDFSLSTNNAHQAGGIQLWYSTGYTIEENTITSTAPAPTMHYGIFTHNSGEAANEIYKNTIVGTQLGLWHNGTSYNLNAPSIGLEYRCNEMVGVNFENIAISNTGPNSGVAQLQGTCLPIRPPADNLFSQLCGNATDDIHCDAGAQNQFLQYSYSASGTGVVPTCFSAQVIPSGCANLTTRSCPSRIQRGPRPLQPVAAPATKAMVQKAKLQADALVDGGRTPELLYSVRSGKLTSAEIRQAMEPHKGYLSDEVIMALMELDQPLDRKDLLEILIDNSGLSPVVYSAAKSTYPRFTSQQLKALENAQSGSSPRHELELSVASMQQSYGLALNRKIQTFANLGDSASNRAGLISTLADCDDSESRKQLVKALILDGQADRAKQELNILANQGGHELFIQYAELLVLVEELACIEELVGRMDILGGLLLIAQSKHYGQEVANARGLLQMAGVVSNYQMVPPTHQASGPREEGSEAPESTKLGLIVSPNPAHSEANISIELADPSKVIGMRSLRIVDVANGRTVREQQSENGSWNIDLHGLSSGVYICILRFEDRTYVEKLVIQ